MNKYYQQSYERYEYTHNNMLCSGFACLQGVFACR